MTLDEPGTYPMIFPMQLTGLLLGAGASHEIGMPLVWELTKELRTVLTPEKLREFNAHWRLGPGGGHSDQVMDDFAAIANRQDLHYENILGYLETQQRRPANHALLQEYHGLYAWLVELVYHALAHRHAANVEYIKRNVRFFSGLAHFIANNAPLWVFSLNHDLIVECLAVEHNVTLNSGFSTGRVSFPIRFPDGAKKGDLQADFISGDDLESGRANFLQPGTPGINLLKIHGALDIFAFRDGYDFLKLLPQEPSIASIIETVRSANDELFFPEPNWPRGRVKTTNEIAYADDTGEMQFLRRSILAGAFKFDTRRGQVLSTKFLDLFRHNINYVTKLVCIGYSFGDTHINDVLRQWLEFVADRRLVIVGPGLKSPPNFLMHVAPQVESVDALTTDYLDSVAGIVRGRAEMTEKRFARWARRYSKHESQSKFQAFLLKHLDRTMRGFAERISQFLQPDGTFDSVRAGSSREDFAKRFVGDVVGTPDRLMEEFLETEAPEQK